MYIKIVRPLTLTDQRVSWSITIQINLPDSCNKQKSCHETIFLLAWWEENTPSSVKATDHETIPAVGWACLAQCGGVPTIWGDYCNTHTRARARTHTHTHKDWKHQAFQVARERVHFANVFRMGSSSTYFAHAHISHPYQGSSPCLWTVHVLTHVHGKESVTAVR